jgi:hypothetical protein
MRQSRRNGFIRESGFVRETGDDKTRKVVKGVRPAPVAQLDRVADFESVGHVFESRRAHHIYSYQ